MSLIIVNWDSVVFLHCLIFPEVCPLLKPELWNPICFLKLKTQMNSQWGSLDMNSWVDAESWALKQVFVTSWYQIRTISGSSMFKGESLRQVDTGMTSDVLIQSPCPCRSFLLLLDWPWSEDLPAGVGSGGTGNRPPKQKDQEEEQCCLPATLSDGSEEVLG